MDRLDQMEAFIRVVDAGSFTAAARQWGRSKAVVSKYINALEDHLGVELLRRTTRSLSLTEAGRAYRERCADVLGEIQSLEASVREDIAAPRGPLRVTAPPGLAGHYLDVMTSGFLTRYPEVTLDLDLTHRMVDLVEENIDIAIRVTDPRDSSLVARRIAPAPILAVASPDYLRRRGTPKKPADLRDHDCIVDTNFRDQQRWRFRSRRSGGKTETVSVDGPLRVNHPDAVREMAEAGLGVALVPDFVAREALEAGRLCEVLRGRGGVPVVDLGPVPTPKVFAGEGEGVRRAFVGAHGGVSAPPPPLRKRHHPTQTPHSTASPCEPPKSPHQSSGSAAHRAVPPSPQCTRPTASPAQSDSSPLSERAPVAPRCPASRNPRLF